MSHNLILVRGKEWEDLTFQTPTSVTRLVEQAKVMNVEYALAIIEVHLRHECEWYPFHIRKLLDEIRMKIKDGWEFGAT